MPTAIVLEDGTGIANANSYVGVTDVIAYCASNGLTVDDTQGKVTANLLLAMIYLENKSYKGSQTYIGQALQWPRSQTNIINGYLPLLVGVGYGPYYNGNGVPLSRINTTNLGVSPLIVQAQMQLVLEQFKGIVLFKSNQSSKFIIDEQLDIFRTQYANANVIDKPSIPMVDILLSTLLASNGGSFKGSVRA